MKRQVRQFRRHHRVLHFWKTFVNCQILVRLGELIIVESILDLNYNHAEAIERGWMNFPRNGFQFDSKVLLAHILELGFFIRLHLTQHQWQNGIRTLLIQLAKESVSTIKVVLQDVLGRLFSPHQPRVKTQSAR